MKFDEPFDTEPSLRSIRDRWNETHEPNINLLRKAGMLRPDGLAHRLLQPRHRG